MHIVVAAGNSLAEEDLIRFLASKVIEMTIFISWDFFAKLNDGDIDESCFEVQVASYKNAMLVSFVPRISKSINI